MSSTSSGLTGRMKDDLPKTLYLNPTLNNSSTATMSMERREAVTQIARRYGVPIIEDDAYGRLPIQRPPTLASIAPGLTFYITGFAKCLDAGLRIAFIAAPNARYTARIAATMGTTMVMASPPLLRLTTRRIHDGTARAASHGIPQEPRARQELARELPA
jgi:DNA-binding transcriptional MocR family regulator